MTHGRLSRRCWCVAKLAWPYLKFVQLRHAAPRLDLSEGNASALSKRVRELTGCHSVILKDEFLKRAQQLRCSQPVDVTRTGATDSAQQPLVLVAVHDVSHRLAINKQHTSDFASAVATGIPHHQDTIA
jgi:hypothetical protein